jgi:hypothetical protein
MLSGLKKNKISHVEEITFLFSFIGRFYTGSNIMVIFNEL